MKVLVTEPINEKGIDLLKEHGFEVVNGTGIDPDYEVEYEYSGPKEADYDMQYDTQAQYALELMREMLE